MLPQPRQPEHRGARPRTNLERQLPGAVSIQAWDTASQTSCCPVVCLSACPMHSVTRSVGWGLSCFAHCGGSRSPNRAWSRELSKECWSEGVRLRRWVTWRSPRIPGWVSWVETLGDLEGGQEKPPWCDSGAGRGHRWDKRPVPANSALIRRLTCVLIMGTWEEPRLFFCLRR